MEAIVVDVGSGRIRVGYAGQEKPSFSFPSILTLDSSDRLGLPPQPRKLATGFERRILREDPSIVDFFHPVTKGVVRDWDGLDKLLVYGFSELMCGSYARDQQQKELIALTEDKNTEGSETEKDAQKDQTEGAEGEKQKEPESEEGQTKMADDPEATLSPSGSTLEKGESSLSEKEDQNEIVTIQDVQDVDVELAYLDAVENQQRKMLFTESIANPRNNREYLAQLIFEGNFPCNAMAILPQPLLALYGSGRSTGIVVDSGEGQTSIVPFNDGNIIPEGIMHLPFSGSDLSQYLDKLISESPTATLTTEPIAEKHPLKDSVLHDLKRKHTYVAIDYKDAVTRKKYTTQQYNLANKLGTINLGLERIQCPEALFQPHELLGIDSLGIHDAIIQSINMCDQDRRKILFDNVILAGGNTMFTGFPERLRKELNIATPPVYEANIIATPERHFLTWYGGSILGSGAAFDTCYISKSDYDEFGPSIANKNKLV